MKAHLLKFSHCPQHIKNKFDPNIALRTSSNDNILLNVTEDQIQKVDDHDASLVVKSLKPSNLQPSANFLIT